MKDGRGGVSHVAGFCIFHLVSLKKGCIQNISFQYCLDWIKIRLYTKNQNPYISLYFIYLCQKTPPPPILFINHFKSLRTESLKMEKIRSSKTRVTSTKSVTTLYRIVKRFIISSFSSLLEL